MREGLTARNSLNDCSFPVRRLRADGRPKKGSPLGHHHTPERRAETQTGKPTMPNNAVNGATASSEKLAQAKKIVELAEEVVASTEWGKVDDVLKDGRALLAAVEVCDEREDIALIDDTGELDESAQFDARSAIEFVGESLDELDDADIMSRAEIEEAIGHAKDYAQTLADVYGALADRIAGKEAAQ